MKKIFVLLMFVSLLWSSCKKDSDNAVQCQNGGTATNGSCVCPFGYQGSACETEIRSKFYGTFDVSLNCSGPLSYTLQVVPATGDVTRVKLINFDDQGQSFSALAVLESGNLYGLNIPQQTVDGLQLSGSISTTSNPGIFNFYYQITDGVESASCSGTIIRR